MGTTAAFYGAWEAVRQRWSGRKLPDHPAHQQIMAVFTEADAPLRARQVCEAMDLEIAPHNINNTRLKLKRLTERGIQAETEQGLFTQPRPQPPGDVAGQPACPSGKGETSISSRTPMTDLVRR